MIFAPFWGVPIMAASAPELSVPEDVTMNDSVRMDEDEDDENDPFQVVRPKNRRPKSAKRRRKGTTGQYIENISRTTHYNSTDMTDSDNSSNQKPKQTQPPQSDLKILFVSTDPSRNLTKVNPIAIAKSIKECVGQSQIDFVKIVRDGILVKCFNIKQVQALKQVQKIGTIPVKIRERTFGIKGLITGVPIEVTDDELKEELKSQKVVGVQRMKKINKQDRVETPTQNVIITFNSDTLPERVHFCFLIFKVRTYIPQVIRCFKCQHYGHGISQCRAKERCVRCGEEHSFDNCTKKENPKCVNCGGPHSAAYNGCKEAKKAKEIQTLKVTQKITYAQAIKTWNINQSQPKPTTQQVLKTPPLVELIKTQEQPSTSHQKEGITLTVPKQSHPQEYVTQPTKIQAPTTSKTKVLESSHTEQIKRDTLDILESGSILAIVSDELLIRSIAHLIRSLCVGRAERDIFILVKTAAERLLQVNV